MFWRFVKHLRSVVLHVLEYVLLFFFVKNYTKKSIFIFNQWIHCLKIVIKLVLIDALCVKWASPFLFQRKCVAPTGDQLCDAHVWPANRMQCLWETTQVLAYLNMCMSERIKWNNKLNDTSNWYFWIIFVMEKLPNQMYWEVFVNTCIELCGISIT